VRKVEYDHINSELKSCECGCSEQIHSINKLGKPARIKHNHHLKMYVGSNHSQWRGGRRKHGHGYIYIWNPKHHFATKTGYVLEHRLVWEEQHKACLLEWSDVHHKDHDKVNNIWYNLQAMMQGEHSRFHRLNP
jgi:hypothetical protein